MGTLFCLRFYILFFRMSILAVWMRASGYSFFIFLEADEISLSICLQYFENLIGSVQRKQFFQNHLVRWTELVERDF